MTPDRLLYAQIDRLALQLFANRRPDLDPAEARAAWKALSPDTRAGWRAQAEGRLYDLRRTRRETT